MLGVNSSFATNDVASLQRCKELDELLRPVHDKPDAPDQDTDRILLHPELLFEVKRGDFAATLFLRNRLPLLFYLALYEKKHYRVPEKGSGLSSLTHVLVPSANSSRGEVLESEQEDAVTSEGSGPVHTSPLGEPRDGLLFPLKARSRRAEKTSTPTAPSHPMTATLMEQADPSRGHTAPNFATTLVPPKEVSLSHAACVALAGDRGTVRAGSSEASTASCGPVWDVPTARWLLSDGRPLVELTCEVLGSACEWMETLANIAAKNRIDWVTEATPDTEEIVLSSSPSFRLAVSMESLKKAIDVQRLRMRHALLLLESMLVAAVLGNTFYSFHGGASLNGAAGQRPNGLLDEMQERSGPPSRAASISGGRGVGGGERGGAEESPLSYLIRSAIHAFLQAFLAITTARQILSQFAHTAAHEENIHGGDAFHEESHQSEGSSPSGSMVKTAEQAAATCAACAGFHELEETIVLCLQSTMGVVKKAAIAFAAHDTDIAEGAIEYIDSQGPIFRAQATMLLAHVLTPEVLAAHPPSSRGGQALKWVLSFVFGGCDGGDVVRHQRQRLRARQEAAAQSMCFSLANSSLTPSSSRSSSYGALADRDGGNWTGSNSNASGQETMSNDEDDSHTDNEDGEGGIAHAAPAATWLRVEFILAASFTRCHPLMTVIGSIAENNSYGCGVTVARAVLKYAATLSQTAARLLRTPVLTDRWLTPFTEAMMRGLTELATNVDQEENGGAASFDTDAETIAEVLPSTWSAAQRASVAPLARVALQRFQYVQANSPQPAVVTGTTPADEMEAAELRTHRRCLGIHWAKCVVLSGRTLAKAGISEVQVPHGHSAQLYLMQEKLKQLLAEYRERMLARGEGAAEGNRLFELIHHLYDLMESESLGMWAPSHLDTPHVGRSEEDLSSPRDEADHAESVAEKREVSHHADGEEEGDAGTNTNDSFMTAGTEKECYRKAFVDSFCFGRPDFDLLAATTTVLQLQAVSVPLHVVMFSSLYLIFEAMGDVLLCEKPRLNSAFVNEVITLIYEVRLSMLEAVAPVELLTEKESRFRRAASFQNPPNAGSRHGNSEEHSARAYSSEAEEMDDADRDSRDGALSTPTNSLHYHTSQYNLLFPPEYAVLLNSALRISTVISMWKGASQKEPGHPSKGYISLLQHLKRRIDRFQAPDTEELYISRSTLRLLLGATTRDESGVMHGNVLHVDDLDIEGCRKEEMIPRLGVSASRDSMRASKDDLESLVKVKHVDVGIYETPASSLAGSVVGGPASGGISFLHPDLSPVQSSPAPAGSEEERLEPPVFVVDGVDADAAFLCAEDGAQFLQRAAARRRGRPGTTTVVLAGTSKELTEMVSRVESSWGIATEDLKARLGAVAAAQERNGLPANALLMVPAARTRHSRIEALGDHKPAAPAVPSPSSGPTQSPPYEPLGTAALPPAPPSPPKWRDRVSKLAETLLQSLQEAVPSGMRGQGRRGGTEAAVLAPSELPVSPIVATSPSSETFSPAVGSLGVPWEDGAGAMAQSGLGSETTDAEGHPIPDILHESLGEEVRQSPATEEMSPSLDEHNVST